MSIDTIAVTGGNGKIGEATLEHLGEHGYETVNVARGKRREEVSDQYRTTDLLDAGEVYGSLARSGADAVVHMGTIPGPQSHPGHVTFESNAMSAWNVLEAASHLELESVVLASSINVMGAAYQDAPTHVEYLPVDEAHPLTPRDPYALGKHAIEVTADGYGRLPDAPTVSSLRYPWVATSDELREEFVENDRTLTGLDDAWHHTTRDTVFSYLHVDDGVEIARLAAEADHDGHEAFWAVAADTTATEPSSVVAEEYFPEAEVREPLEDRETFISIDKARDLLGWEPNRSWTDL
jgi:nucleoside-diphosphate-sugar epimerase